MYDAQAWTLSFLVLVLLPWPPKIVWYQQHTTHLVCAGYVVVEHVLLLGHY